MKSICCAFGALCLAMCAMPAAAEQLTTESIVTLSKTGIGDDAIIAKIRAENVHFNLSVDEMIALKDKGVSSAVIAAMMTAPKAPEIKMSLDSPDPMVPHPAGVYLFDQLGADPKMVKMNPTVSNQAKTGGILGYTLTGGIASLSIKAAIPNETARTITGKKPIFYFFFDQSNDVEASNAWASGANISITSPAEFSLIELMKKKGRREARVGSANLGGAKTGVMDKDRIPFEYTEVRPGVFKVEASNVANPGEYGFIFALGGSGAGGAMTARIFDFSVQ